MVKQTQTILRQQPMNCLSVFHHFVRLAIKGLKTKFLWQYIHHQVRINHQVILFPIFHVAMNCTDKNSTDKKGTRSFYSYLV